MYVCRYIYICVCVYLFIPLAHCTVAVRPFIVLLQVHSAIHSAQQHSTAKLDLLSRTPKSALLENHAMRNSIMSLGGSWLLCVGESNL